MRRVGALLLSANAFWAAGAASACELPLIGWNAQMLYEEAAVIVDAVVTKVELVEKELPGELAGQREGTRVTFETVEALKGKPRKIDTVWANSTFEKGCVFTALAGQEYLLVIMASDEIKYGPRKGKDPYGHVSILGSQLLLRSLGEEGKQFKERTLSPVRQLLGLQLKEQKKLEDAFK